MLMQDKSGGASNGQPELYTYQPSTASLAGINVGTVGSNLNVVGWANLLGNGETQMVMQQNNGNFWLYTYSASTNTLSGQFVGAVGSNFHVVGFGPLGTASQDEMLMQDAAGNFVVYQYKAGVNAFMGSAMGTVGAPWVRGSRPLPRRDRRAAQALPRRSYRLWLRLTRPEQVTARHSRSSQVPIHLSKPS
jgi:hypothetical protein